MAPSLLHRDERQNNYQKHFFGFFCYPFIIIWRSTPGQKKDKQTFGLLIMAFPFQNYNWYKK